MRGKSCPTDIDAAPLPEKIEREDRESCKGLELLQKEWKSRQRKIEALEDEERVERRDSPRTRRDR
eukprot:1781765-Rhodomonas_salina.1